MPTDFRVRGESLSQRIRGKLSGKHLLRFLPILSWLPSYDWHVSFFGDLSGGLTMAVFNVPQGIALAGITGVNPVYGLYTAIFPSFMYIFFGTSKHNALGGFAVLSLVTSNAIEKVMKLSNSSSTVNTLDGNGTDTLEWSNSSLFEYASNETMLLDEMAKASVLPPDPITIATTLLFMSAAMQILAGLFRLNWFFSYFSEQVMSGFIVGGMVHVFFAQIGPALGISLPYRSGPGYLYYRVLDVVERLHLIHLPSVWISTCSIVFLVGSKEVLGPWLDTVFYYPVPFELILVIVGITATNFAEIATRHQIPVVGNIPTNFPPPSLPRVDHFLTLYLEAFYIFFVATTIHINVAKFVEKRFDYIIDYRQELFALGFVGVLSSFFPVFPFTSGFQRSVVGAAVGGSTQLTCMFSSLALLSVILYIGPALEYLPQCILASIILVTMKNGFVKCYELKDLWPTFKVDAFIWVSSALLTVCYDMAEGALAATLIAVFTTVVRTQWPRWHLMHRADEGYREAGRTVDGGRKTVVLRLDAPLLFTSVDRFTHLVQNCVRKWEKANVGQFVRMDSQHGDNILDEKIARVRGKKRNGKEMKGGEKCHLIIDCSMMPYVDYMGLTTMKKVFVDQEAAGVRVAFVVHQVDLLKTLGATDFYSVVGQDRVFPSVEKAVISSENNFAQFEDPPQPFPSSSSFDDWEPSFPSLEDPSPSIPFSEPVQYSEPPHYSTTYASCSKSNSFSKSRSPTPSHCPSQSSSSPSQSPTTRQPSSPCSPTPSFFHNFALELEASYEDKNK